MDIAQTKTILKRIQAAEADVEILRQTRLEVARSGYASATISSGGGSRSYTRANLPQLTELIQQLEREIKTLRKQLATGGTGGLWRNVSIVYS